MRRYRLVFDLDDTLYPERAFAISAFGAAADWARTTLGVDGLQDEMTRLLDDGHLGQLFRIVLDRRGLDPAHAAGLIEAYRRHQPSRLDLYDDAARLLDGLGEAGPLGLITDGTPGVQRAKVAALGVAPRFARIIYTHDAGGREFAKPHPGSFETMQRAIGGPGERMVYIGDNPAKDFQAPNRLGWLTIQVERPQRIHATATAIADGAPQHRVSTLAEIPALLAGTS